VTVLALIPGRLEEPNPESRDFRVRCFASPRNDVAKTSNQEETMIKVSVMYPNQPGARFDHDYYREKHMPLVKTRMGDSCKYYTIDKGLAGGAPGAPATYVGMCHIFADSVDAFQKGFGPHAKEILADIANYTDIAPVMQISEVVVEK
jgi:uncharacterized protein (TIGR02118 family)